MDILDGQGGCNVARLVRFCAGLDVVVWEMARESPATNAVCCVDRGDEMACRNPGLVKLSLGSRAAVQECLSSFNARPTIGRGNHESHTRLVHTVQSVPVIFIAARDRYNITRTHGICTSPSPHLPCCPRRLPVVASVYTDVELGSQKSEPCKTSTQRVFEEQGTGAEFQHECQESKLYKLCPRVPNPIVKAARPSTPFPRTLSSPLFFPSPSLHPLPHPYLHPLIQPADCWAPARDSDTSPFNRPSPRGL